MGVLISRDVLLERLALSVPRGKQLGLELHHSVRSHLLGWG